jgi:phage protein U
MSIGVLDDVTFEVTDKKFRTWQEMRRSGAARWVAHDVYQGKPVQEFIGPGLESVELLRIRFDANMGVTPKDELQKLRDKRDAGDILQFTVGDNKGAGELIGDFIIKDIKEVWRFLSRTGVLLIAEADLALEEYV